MIYGFTGTREGMTSLQRAALEELLYMCQCGEDQFHHGGCRGADMEAHHVAACLITRVVHPASGEWADRSDYGELRDPKPFLVRDHNIVDECDVLIAAPCSLTEEQRGGTWATIRYARKQGKPVIILDPGG